MTVRTLAATAALLGCFSFPARAQGAPEHTTIDLAGHAVPVVKGGLYDRFRSNPPLSVIQAEAPEVDLSWFRTLPKQRVDMGFESWSPNFYYQTSRVTAIFTADLDTLRQLMPAKVLETVQPLQVWPGRGLVAFTAYAYHYCDNDRYDEIGLSIVTSKPGGANLGPFSLLGQSMSNEFWGYVLKLPVNTELARVRGVVGYNLPKWLTGISYRDEGESVLVEVLDAQTGKTDLTFQARKLSGLSTKPTLVTNRFTNVDRQGRLTTGHTVSRQLRHASSTSADTVDLRLGDGSLSAFMKTLQLGRLVRYEYVPDFQSALYATEPL